MYKLVILIQDTQSPAFDSNWPEFLHLAEQMPGLQREATSRIHHTLYGDVRCEMIHELYFESLEDLQQAMATPVGNQAGQILQKMTDGKVTLLIGDHNADDLENIRSHQRRHQASDGTEEEAELAD